MNPLTRFRRYVTMTDIREEFDEQEKVLLAEKAEINRTGTYTTEYRWPAPMCLRCGAIVGDRDVHDASHDAPRT